MLSRRSLLVAALALLVDPVAALAAGPPDGRYLAVLDRFERGADGRLAVLVLERGGETRGRLVVSPDELPEDARHADAVLAVEVSDGALADATYLPEVTAERAEAAQERFDRLAHGTCEAG